MEQSKIIDRLETYQRASRACGSAIQAETEAGCVESDESVASFSVSAAIIEEK